MLRIFSPFALFISAFFYLVIPVFQILGKIKCGLNIHFVHNDKKEVVIADATKGVWRMALSERRHIVTLYPRLWKQAEF